MTDQDIIQLWHQAQDQAITGIPPAIWLARKLEEKMLTQIQLGTEDRAPDFWRMVTPEMGNVIHIEDPAEAKRFKEMDGREVRPAYMPETSMKKLDMQIQSVRNAALEDAATVCDKEANLLSSDNEIDARMFANNVKYAAKEIRALKR